MTFRSIAPAQGALGIIGRRDATRQSTLNGQPPYSGPAIPHKVTSRATVPVVSGRPHAADFGGLTMTRVFAIFFGLLALSACDGDGPYSGTSNGSYQTGGY